MAPVVPCPVLVGRADELDAVTTVLDRARLGRGGLVFVTGEAGVGKSRLAHEVIEIARANGMMVLRGRAVPGSSASAYRPLAGAFAAVVPDEGAGDGSAARASTPSPTPASRWCAAAGPRYRRRGLASASRAVRRTCSPGSKSRNALVRLAAAT